MWQNDKWSGGWMERVEGVVDRKEVVASSTFHCWDAFYAFRDKMHLHFVVTAVVAVVVVDIVVVEKGGEGLVGLAVAL